ncbi:SDR family oxidoreductase [Salinicoccus sp. HZC-1]|uniref:SDR family oxidoreductase n=1 Tax=Salinicoccus sp. HZC-1 TaxID=3385497 RepID=UPI00398AD2B1
MNNKNLSGKTAVVTGGGGVLGSHFCKALASAGAKVAILGRTLENCEIVAEEINNDGGEAIGLSCDVTDKTSVEAARAEINEKFGTCDILVNGAGGNSPSASTDDEYLDLDTLDDPNVKNFFALDTDGIDFVFKLNFLGTLIPSQIFGADMAPKEHATVINISSMNAYTPLTKIPAYSGAKSSVTNFTQWLSVYLSKTGVRVNGIAPGFLATKQNKDLLFDGDGNLTDRSHKIINATPMGRFGEPEELLGTLLYLADEKASGFVTGITIPVDGGFSAYSGV